LVATPASSASSTAQSTACSSCCNTSARISAHLPVTTGAAQQLALQLLERLGHLRKRRTIAQRFRLALDHRQIMPPVIDGSPGQVVRPFDDPGMLAQDLPFCRHNNPLGIDPDAERTVGERGGDAVTVALKVDEADRRDPLGVLVEAVEGPPQRHRAADLGGMHIGHGARQATMLDIAPLRDALLLEPDVERIDVREARQSLPQSAPRIQYVLLDLSLLPPEARLQKSGSNR
jgi:hypothetical protein